MKVVNRKHGGGTGLFIALAALLLAGVWPGQAAAQTETRTEQLKKARQKKAETVHAHQPGFLEKTLLWVENNQFTDFLGEGYYGFFVMLGGMKSGSGTGGGIRYNPTNKLNPFHFDVRAMGSIKGYTHAAASTGFEYGGFSLFGFGQMRHSPEENFFGLGEDSQKKQRSDYTLDDKKAGVLAALRPWSWLSTVAQITYLDAETGSGHHSELPSVEGWFADQLEGVLGKHHQYWIYTAGIRLDFRGQAYEKNGVLGWAMADNFLDGRSRNPYRGTMVSFRFRRFDQHNAGLHDFDRYEIELQQYFAFLHGHRVLAFRGFCSVTDKSDDAELPFYLMQPLGGSMSMRGYLENRFFDNHALLFNAEYRWYAFSGLDMALFADAGNVFHDVDDMGLNDLKISYGIGFHFNSKTSMPLRVDFAHGDEGFRTIIKFSNVF